MPKHYPTLPIQLLILLLVIPLTCICAPDRPANPDSLILRSKKAYLAGKYDKAAEFATEAYHLAESLRIDSADANARMMLGAVLQQQNRYIPAIAEYTKAAAIYKRTGNLIRLARAYLNTGICLKSLSLYQPAIAHYLQACTYFGQEGDQRDLANAYNSIGLCFCSLEKYEPAIKYTNRALAIRQRLNDPVLLGQSYNNAGFIYKSAGRPDSAIAFLNKSILYYRSSSDSSLLILPLQNLGSAWLAKQNGDAAEKHIRRALAISAVYDRMEETARGKLDLAELFLFREQYDAGLHVAAECRTMAAELRLPELLMQSDMLLGRLSEGKGDYRAATASMKRGMLIRDSLLSIAHNNAISEMEIRFQTQEKERDIAALRTQDSLNKRIVSGQRQLIILLCVAAVMLLLLLLLAYRNFRLKARANRRISTLMRDLHHRIKNNLQMLSGLFTIQISSATDEATRETLRENESRLRAMNLIHSKLYRDEQITTIEMHGYLTDLLDNIIDSFTRPTGPEIDLQTRVETIELDADVAVAIGLLVNELATNSLKHAFGNMSAGEIRVTLGRTGGNMILLSYCDNGRGFEPAPEKKRDGFGTQLVRLMVQQLDAEMQVSGKAGMNCEIHIPLSR